MSNLNPQSFDSATAETGDCVGDPRSELRSLARVITGFALPQRCELCVAPARDRLLCVECERSLPRIAQPCPVCGLPAPRGRSCGACSTHPPPFAATVAAFAYEFPIDRLLQEIKYGGRIALAEWAGSWLGAVASVALAHRQSSARPDRIVALPLAPSRQKERGFNQAREIAVHVARRTGLPVAAPLRRVAAGAPQARLPWAERGRNVRGVFSVVSPVVGARIALVDDVMTTGATLSEAARTLVEARADRVECWVVARTLPR